MSWSGVRRAPQSTDAAGIEGNYRRKPQRNSQHDSEPVPSGLNIVDQLLTFEFGKKINDQLSTYVSLVIPQEYMVFVHTNA